MPRITQGTSLYLKKNNEASFSKLINLQNTPDFGKGEKASVEKTTLDDDTRQYMAGLREPSDKLKFKFLYDAGETNSSYEILKSLESGDFQLAYPDGTAFQFSADVDVIIDGAEIGDPLTFTLTLIPSSAITESNIAQTTSSQTEVIGDEK